MPGLINFVKEVVSVAPGTGVITLGGAAPGGHMQFQQHPDVINGSKWLCVAEDGNNNELGIYTWNTGNTLTRTTILETLNAGVYDNSSPVAITLSSATTVSIVGAADAVGIVIGRASASSTTYTPITNIVPIDDTLPTDTETDSIVSVTYTPKYADSTLIIRASVGLLRSDSGVLCAICIFKTGTSTALRTSALQTTGNSYVEDAFVEHELPAGSTESQTFTLRIGKSSGGVYLNGGSSASLFGTSTAATITVEEIRQ